MGKAARLSIYWQDAACRLVIPLRQVALVQLYKVSPSKRQCGQRHASLKPALAHWTLPHESLTPSGCGTTQRVHGIQNRELFMELTYIHNSISPWQKIFALNLPQGYLDFIWNGPIHDLILRTAWMQNFTLYKYKSFMILGECLFFFQAAHKYIDWPT